VGLDAPGAWVMINLALTVAVVGWLWWREEFRPGSVSRSGRRGVGEHGPVTWLAVGAIVFLTQQVSAGGAVMLLHDDPEDLSTRSLALITAAGMGAGLAVALVLGRLLSLSAPEAGLGMRPRYAALGLLLGLAVFPVTQSVGFAAVWVNHRLGLPHEDIAHKTLRRLADEPASAWMWVLVSLAVLAAPIVEEFIYRACLQSAVLRATGRPWVAILASSAIFTAAHVGVGPWYGLAAVGALSVGLGMAFERTKSLAVPIGMHTAFNALNVALVFVMGPA
jgi:uncharacterized protein